MAEPVDFDAYEDYCNLSGVGYLSYASLEAIRARGNRVLADDLAAQGFIGELALYTPAGAIAIFYVHRRFRPFFLSPLPFSKEESGASKKSQEDVKAKVRSGEV
jgi:hypothetical protein